MNFERALRCLEDRQETRIRLGLGRIRNHLKRLGNPQFAFAVVHVAGTNAKGSVCAMLASILQSAGYKTGLYTSPHLMDARERIQVAGRPISKSDFARISEKTLRLDSQARLTYFEMLTSMAFQYFQKKGVQIAVLETGLGGRFDATNVVEKPLAAVVTTIDYDHQQFLGSTLSAIAREKAGIFKRDAYALCGETKSGALQMLRKEARRKQSIFEALPRRTGWRMHRTDWQRGIQVLRGPGRSELNVSILGDSQSRNAALVLKTVERLRKAGLNVPDSAIRRGLECVRWPGRFQVMPVGRRRFILDGAHNVEAMRHFCSTLRASPWRKSRKTFIVGVLRDKEHRKMMRVLAPELHRVIVTEPLSPRALSCGELAREIAEAAPKAKVSVIADPAQAIEAWRSGSERTSVACVCGSFYLVGVALEMMGGHRV